MCASMVDIHLDFDLLRFCESLW